MEHGKAHKAKYLTWKILFIFTGRKEGRRKIKKRKKKIEKKE